jgi:uncharacterized protein (TIGR02246 family)
MESTMTVAAKTKTRDEAQIRQLIDTWVEALHAKNVDRIMSVYAPDVHVFDIAPPLQHAGAEAHRRSFAEWFKGFAGPIGSDIRDLRITAGDDVAFCHCLNRVSGTPKGGEAFDHWVRVTVCCRKRDGAWKVAHEHVSVPFHMDGSFRAAVDLEP